MQQRGTSTCTPSTSMFQDLFTPLAPAEAAAPLGAAASLQAIGRQSALLNAHVLPHVHVTIEATARMFGCLRECVDDVLRRKEQN